MEILSPKKSRGILGIWQYNIYTFLKIGRSTSQWYASNHACSRLSETSIKRLYVGFTVMWGTGDPKTLTPVRGPHQRTTKKNYQWNRDLKILMKTRTNSCISVIHHRVLEMRLIDRNRNANMYNGRLILQVTGHKSLLYQYRKYPKHL